MAFLTDRCARVPLSPKIVAACAPFSCGNKDLDEFFSADFMFSTEEQEKQYRNISDDSPLNTRLMFFDLMQIAAEPSAAV